MSAPKTGSGCVFCTAAATRRPAETLTLYRNEHVVVLLNRYPYTNGHLMVAPVAHHSALGQSDSATLHTLMRVTAEAQRILSEVYHPDGFNVGMNLGSAAGAGIADHYHMHVVPRWSGDSNFMAVTAQTRMVPEDLDETWKRLVPRFRKLRKEFV